MNEYELVYLAQEQNEDALLLLYQNYEKIIKNIVFQNQFYINCLNGDSKELYSLCLTNFGDAIEKYNANSNASFYTFVIAILKRTVSGYLYKQRTKQKSGICINEEYDDNIYVLESNKKDPLNELYFYDVIKELDTNAKKRLSKFEYQVYYYLKLGLTYQQIAEILSKSAKQIDNAIQRIKNKLKKLEIN